MKWILFLVAFILIGVISISLYKSCNLGSCDACKEGFNPYNPEHKPVNYPDQTYDSNLVTAEKHIQTLLNNPDLSVEQKQYLNDLLILLQSI